MQLSKTNFKKMETKFLITSLHNVYKDDFTDGEQEHTNFYTLDATIKAENYKDAITEFLQNTCYFNLGFENVEYNHDTQTFETACLVDCENNQPTNEEVNLWKEGEEILYTNVISISLEVVTPFTYKF